LNQITYLLHFNKKKIYEGIKTLVKEWNVEVGEGKDNDEVENTG